MSFTGFSEDEIRKVAKGHDVSKVQKGVSKPTLKKVPFKANGLRSKNISAITVSKTQAAPENAKLSKNQKPPEMEEQVKLEENKTPEIIEPPKSEKRKFIDLEEFEAKQKLIEQENRKRKELLSKALADRTKRTQEEAQKLNAIQDEFKKLDASLSDDVKILRKQIELASIEYMECQKRYHKIEKEYLDAKLQLHQKQEKKEMLTEHLCTIIEKNEETKAEKLNELLQKLQLSPDETSLPTADTK